MIRNVAQWIAVWLGIAVAVLMLREAWAEDLSDFPTATLDAGETARRYSAGSEGAVQAWIMVDCVGLAAAPKLRCEDAARGEAGANPSRLVRAVAHLADECAGGQGFRKAALTSEWLCSVTLTESVYRRMKGCFNDATCSQSGRVRIFTADWATVKVSPRCVDFFPAVVSTSGTFVPCNQPTAPAVFYGVAEPTP